MTMREEFEAWWQQKGNGTYRRADMFMRDEDAPDEYFYSDVQHGWRLHQAAYAAGQRAERAECAQTAHRVANERIAPLNTTADISKAQVIRFQGQCDGAMMVHEAIRNRKEQG